MFSSLKNCGCYSIAATIYKFIFVRGLFVHSALVAPYFMIERNGDVKELLPIYIGAEATAALLSSIIWGKIADKSAKLTLRLSGLLALGACVGLLFWQISLDLANIL